MTEIWRDVKDYEGLYQVSNWGKFLSLNYHQTGKPGLMNPSERKDGYLQVGLRKNGETNLCLVHRLVAETFLPNPENKPCINHKIEGDEGKKINMVIFNEDGTIDKEKTTIEWVTRKENNDYGTHNERVAKANTNGKLSKRVLQFSKSGDLIREWESIRECGRNGFNVTDIVLCCKGRQKTHKGFIWKYS